MPDTETITRGAGRTHPRTARFFRNVAKYTALTLAGIILFRAGAAYGLKERGYSAVGGEVFALLLPVFWFAAEKIVRDFIEDTKNGFQPKI